jgi:hypothetical protein
MIFFLVFSVYSVNASNIGVQVSGAISSDFKVSAIEEDNNFIAMYFGLHNTGSLDYSARARMDIMGGEQVMFTGWSNEKQVNPGQRTGFVVYGYKPDASNLSLRPRIYYGNELEELAPLETDRVDIDPEHAFRLTSFRTYDRSIRFDLTSNQSLEDVIIMPKAYSSVWIFEQKKIDRLDKGRTKEVIIPYEVGNFRERDIIIAIATEDGLFYQEQQFKLRMESGIMKYVHIFLDWLGSFFRS